ncbi:hypothetical protein ROLI_029580 [Roseobacter fucihabitans]|uniref:Uncharacterized protein n=1 Tax=Roseobacter fucihabitans TaxID=1537242 RepID=A0ABZ2BV91_9RHOB|nr:hypothetical protein [Roseobacter litoralis]MBC6965298.1 hypothetical protein [Roseobacter litoralis]
MSGWLDVMQGPATSGYMNKKHPSSLTRLFRLARGTLSPPPGTARIAIALIYGIVCHVIFALAVLSMIVAMFLGMSLSLGTVPAPWSVLANAALIAQFPIVHSILLTPSGGKLLTKLAPANHGETLPEQRPRLDQNSLGLILR